MSKWYGKVGYADDVETEPGLWEHQIIEKDYYGDLIRTRWMQQTPSDGINDNVRIATSIRMIATDPYAMSHFSKMIYAEVSGVKWKIIDVLPEYPGLTLTLGGVWNGETVAGSAEETPGIIS